MMMGRTIGRGTDEANDPIVRRRRRARKCFIDVDNYLRRFSSAAREVSSLSSWSRVVPDAGARGGTSGSGSRVSAPDRAMSFAMSSEWNDGGAESSLPDGVMRRVLRHVPRPPAHLRVRVSTLASVRRGPAPAGTLPTPVEPRGGDWRTSLRRGVRRQGARRVFRARAPLGPHGHPRLDSDPTRRHPGGCEARQRLTLGVLPACSHLLPHPGRVPGRCHRRERPSHLPRTLIARGGAPVPGDGTGTGRGRGRGRTTA